jgi:hypothetical protein
MHSFPLHVSKAIASRTLLAIVEASEFLQLVVKGDYERTEKSGFEDVIKDAS